MERQKKIPLLWEASGKIMNKGAGETKMSLCSSHFWGRPELPSKVRAINPPVLSLEFMELMSFGQSCKVLSFYEYFSGKRLNRIRQILKEIHDPTTSEPHCLKVWESPAWETPGIFVKMQVPSSTTDPLIEKFSNKQQVLFYYKWDPIIP